MRNVRHGLVAATFAGAAVITTACTSSSEDAVDVSMTEFEFTMPSGSIPAGDVTFSATNEGESVHEIEVFTVPEGVDATSLEVVDNVADTESAGLEVVDEIEDIAPSTTANLTVSLDPGTYALMCNLPGHYAEGMVVPFEVA